MTKNDATLVVLNNMEVGFRSEALDPTLIAIIASVLETVIPACATWLEGSKTTTTAPVQPGFLKMMFLRHQVRKSFVAEGKGRVGYREHGEAVVSSLLKSYNEASPSEISSLVQNQS